MFTPPDRTEAQDQFLAEFTELAMDLARDAGACAKETGDPHEKAELMLAVERLGRSLRLTIALQRRLCREARTQRTEAVETRRQQVRTVLLPQVRASTDHLGERYEREAELDERLAEEALHEAFADLPLETCLERLRDLLDCRPASPFPWRGEGSGMGVAPSPRRSGQPFQDPRTPRTARTGGRTARPAPAPPDRPKAGRPLPQPLSQSAKAASPHRTRSCGSWGSWTSFAAEPPPLPSPTLLPLQGKGREPAPAYSRQRM
jgi:hypothetical protein